MASYAKWVRELEVHESRCCQRCGQGSSDWCRITRCRMPPSPSYDMYGARARNRTENLGIKRHYMCQSWLAQDRQQQFSQVSRCYHLLSGFPSDRARHQMVAASGAAMTAGTGWSDTARQTTPGRRPVGTDL